MEKIKDAIVDYLSSEGYMPDEISACIDGMGRHDLLYTERYIQDIAVECDRYDKEELRRQIDMRGSLHEKPSPFPGKMVMCVYKTKSPEWEALYGKQPRAIRRGIGEAQCIG